MEHLDGLDVAKHEGPEQVVDEVGKPGLDVEAAEPELVLGVLGLVVALVLGRQEVRDWGGGLGVERVEPVSGTTVLKAGASASLESASR